MISLFYVAANRTTLGENWLNVSLPLYVCTYFFHQDHHLKRWLDGLQCSVSWRVLYPDIPIPIRPSSTAMRGIAGPSRLCSTVWAAWVWKREQGSLPMAPSTRPDHHRGPRRCVSSIPPASGSDRVHKEETVVTYLSHPSNTLPSGKSRTIIFILKWQYDLTGLINKLLYLGTK